MNCNEKKRKEFADKLDKKQKDSTVSDTHGSQRMRTRGWQGDRDAMHRAGAEVGAETPSEVTRSEGNTAGGDFNGRTAGGASSSNDPDGYIEREMRKALNSFDRKRKAEGVETLTEPDDASQNMNYVGMWETIGTWVTGYCRC